MRTPAAAILKLMEPHGGGAVAGNEGPSAAIVPEIDGEATLQMISSVSVDHPGWLDKEVCYLGTGRCWLGMACRCNHPSGNPVLASVGADKSKGGHPGQVGQPPCQFSIKTCSCKFGPTCKYHHHKDKAGFAGNFAGYPVCLGEILLAERTDQLRCQYEL